MKFLIAFCVVIAPGCAEYTGVQMKLVEQARKGVAITQASLAEKSRLISEYQKQQRMRLDEAFDADARERADLTSEWVIEHRRAYSAALEAYFVQQQATRDGQLADEKNLEAIDEALGRVLWLQSIELRFANLPKEITP